MRIEAAANSVALIQDDFESKNKAADFSVLFRSCKNVDVAKQLRAFLVMLGKAQNIILSAKLVNLYAFPGDVAFSRSTFDQIQRKDVFTWNSMVAAYVRSGRYREALNCFNEFLSTSDLRADFLQFPSCVESLSQSN
ncbi:hypothetical protein L6164_007033 [Bauhinia variegata]|uniref:Uncharacterized protein n=1 Tax=Bauhinia variegata TaxID=167791 RepID=A0ACB9PZ19_BAUVA|nr:hypothetical protein L6164_007033 [Bauhinia variegata]